MSVMNNSALVNATQKVADTLLFLGLVPQHLMVSSLQNATATITWSPPITNFSIEYDVQILNNGKSLIGCNFL